MYKALELEPKDRYQSAEELKNYCDRYMRIKEMHLETSLFPHEIKINEKTLICPEKWR